MYVGGTDDMSVKPNSIPSIIDFTLNIQVALILRIRWPFSERKLRVTIIKKNFDFDYIISHRLLNCMEAKK